MVEAFAGASFTAGAFLAALLLAGTAAVALPPAEAATVGAGCGWGTNGSAGGISTLACASSNWPTGSGATGSVSGSPFLAAARALATGQPGNTGLPGGGGAAFGKESPSEASRSATNAF